MSYKKIIERIFKDRYRRGDEEVYFERVDIQSTAEKLGVDVPRNLGDLVYYYRLRHDLPASIAKTAPKGKFWIIRLAGESRYRFTVVNVNVLVPNPALLAIKIPDATPEIVAAYAMSDEQALLARLRYNRVLDIFLGVATYSLQNHLRTRTDDLGQIEIDEIYVAVDNAGRQFVLPVQAKSRKDRLTIVQSEQDILWCRERLPALICRSILTKFMDDELIAVFELTIADDEICVVQEKHYRLVPAAEVSEEDLARYRDSP